MAESELFRKVTAMLGPHIGPTMATVSVRLQCGKMGVDPANLNSSHIPQLAVHMKQALGVFIGKERAEQLADQIVYRMTTLTPRA